MGLTAGIVGLPNVGKSTLFNLMTRVFEPTEGEILLDGVNIKSLKEENLRLQGYSNSSATILELLDKNYTDSKMIKGLRFKNDGNFYNTAKVLDNIEMDELTTIVEDKINECTNNILDGNFVINPKVLKGKNRSCEYCNFKDICFMTKKDEVILGGEDDEFYDGTDRSD